MTEHQHASHGNHMDGGGAVPRKGAWGISPVNHGGSGTIRTKRGALTGGQKKRRKILTLALW